MILKIDAMQNAYHCSFIQKVAFRQKDSYVNLSKGQLDEDDVSGGVNAARKPSGRHPAAAKQFDRRVIVAVEYLSISMTYIDRSFPPLFE